MRQGTTWTRGYTVTQENETGDGQRRKKQEREHRLTLYAMTS